MAFSWSRKTIDELLVFMALTVRNSAGKRSTNATFARSGKLYNNVQENKLDTSIFVEQENNRQTSCFHVFTVGNSARKTLGKCSDRALGKTLVKFSGKQAIQ